MSPKECRDRAQSCRQEAARSWGTLRQDFVATAEAWEAMAVMIEAKSDGNRDDRPDAKKPEKP
jgi:hypothetical protein